MPIFELPESFLVTQDIEQIIARCQDFQIKHFLEEQDFDFDGLVIKVSDSRAPKKYFKLRYLRKIRLFSFDTGTPVNNGEDIRSIL